MKRILFAILIALSVISCKAQDYIDWVGQSYEPIKYGYLYNWYAAVDSRKITSSDDWVVPNKMVFENLLNFIDVYDEDEELWLFAGGMLKEMGVVHWNNPNTGATNEYGLNIIGTGVRHFSDGTFRWIKENTFIMGTTLDLTYPNLTSIIRIYNSSSEASILYQEKTYGTPIRLCNPSTLLLEGQTGTYTQNNGTVLNTVVINGVEWLSENLKETKYRDGSTIPVVTDNTAWSNLTTGARCVYNNDEANK